MIRRRIGGLARTLALALSAGAATLVLLVVALVVTAAILGGGFAPKTLGLDGPLHTDAPLLMAHRGVRDEHPENSRGALEAARDAGFEAVEIDVKRSADGRYYLFHDRRSTRLLGVDVELGRQTLAELQRHPLRLDGRATSERILSLDAFAETFADDFIVYLDIKRHGDDDYARLATDIAAFIDTHDLAERSIVGGDFLFIAYFEYRFPMLHTAIGGPGNAWARAYRWIPVRFRPDFTVVRLDEIEPALTDWLRESGLAERWIVQDVTSDEIVRTRELGFSKLLLD